MFNERDPRMMLQRRLDSESDDSRDSLSGDDSGCATFHEVPESVVLDRPFMTRRRTWRDSMPGGASDDGEG